MASQTVVFLAYPGEPSIVPDTVRAALETARRYTSGFIFTPGENIDVDGQLIGDEVLRNISDSNVVVADIIYLNMNVAYEIGFAIGSGKPLCLIRQSDVQDGLKQIKDLGLFDTIGWSHYTSSSDLASILTSTHRVRLIEIPAIKINRRAPLYLLDAYYKTDLPIMVKSRIKKAGLFFRSFDPEESSRLNPHETIKEVMQSMGVVVTLLPTRLGDAAQHSSLFYCRISGGFRQRFPYTAVRRRSRGGRLS